MRPLGYCLVQYRSWSPMSSARTRLSVCCTNTKQHINGQCPSPGGYCWHYYTDTLSSSDFSWLEGRYPEISWHSIFTAVPQTLTLTVRTRFFRKIGHHYIAAAALAPSVARSTATIVMLMWNRQTRASTAKGLKYCQFNVKERHTKTRATLHAEIPSAA